MKAATRVAVLVCVGALTACGSGGTVPSASPTPSTTTAAPQPSISLSPTTAAPATPAPSAATATAATPATPATSATATASGRSATCDPFGSTGDASSTDPLALSTLTGREMRVGQHPCHDRFVLELQGTGSAPGWRVGYRDPLTADPSGLTVQLRGGASLEVVVGVWTVTPYEGRPDDQLPIEGSTQIYTNGYTALQEARVISSFEGVTQIGLGIDTRRPFRVSYLTEPPRLVVDIANS